MFAQDFPEVNNLMEWGEIDISRFYIYEFIGGNTFQCVCLFYLFSHCHLMLKSESCEGVSEVLFNNRWIGKLYVRTTR